MSLSHKIHLRANESIIKTYHPSLGASFGWLTVALALLLTSSFLMFWLFSRGWWGYLLYSLGMALGVFFIFRVWFYRHFKALVITNERLVDIDRTGWLSETISSVSYIDLKDAVIERYGLWGTLCGYGNILIETKSDKFMVEARSISEPQKALALIEDLTESYKKIHRGESVESIFMSFIKIVPLLSATQLERAAAQVDEEYSSRLKEDGSEIEIVV